MGHHQTRAETFLEYLSVDMIKQFPSDPMHQIYLGVVETLLEMMKELHDNPDVDFTIDYEGLKDTADSLSPWIPTEFTRRNVASTQNVAKWKATHSRFFPLYASINIMPHFMPKKYSRHFLKLTCAIRILCDPKLYRTHNEKADELLISFLEDFRKLYGSHRLVYNFHMLLHLAEEALEHGSLETFSAFPFENHMNVLEGFIRKQQQRLQQLYLNLTHKARHIEREKTHRYPQFVKCKNQTRNLPQGCHGWFGKVVLLDYELSTQLPNNISILGDGTIVQIDHFGWKEKEPVMIGKKFEITEDVPLYPLPSRMFNICIVEALSNAHEIWPISSILYKAVIMVYESANHVVPLLHILDE
ncbi:hypothetical protein QAD02_003038 [Eretmocerus hayati]|uniref:Uncharacterized protein n=1 Tax=Eretmocerus hayati TaxID=131215 RepID=A0ACC2NN93_9HYME|nr:hypothetical protein QAD02_003038 [Eretmocerus hayati]